MKPCLYPHICGVRKHRSDTVCRGEVLAGDAKKDQVGISPPMKTKGLTGNKMPGEFDPQLQDAPESMVDGYYGKDGELEFAAWEDPNSDLCANYNESEPNFLAECSDGKLRRVNHETHEVNWDDPGYESSEQATHDREIEHQLKANSAAGIRKVVDVPVADLLPDHIKERVSSPEFRALIEREAALKAELDAQDEDTPAVDRHRVYDAYRATRQDIVEYRYETAQLMEGKTDVPESNFEVPAGFQNIGSAPSGSVEWLKMRQSTVGGSDVGSIVKLGAWGQGNYNSVRESKMDLDLEPNEETMYTYIGNAWEPYTMQAASRALGEPVYTNKDTYSDGKRHINLDGFTKRDGKVHAVIEGKTSSRIEDWVDGPPDGYVLQTAHYMDGAQAEKAYIAAVVNDSRFVMYEVKAEDTVQAGPDTPRALGDEFGYPEARAYSEKMVSKWNRDREKKRAERDNGIPSAEPRRYQRRRFDLTPEEKDLWRRGLKEGMVFADLETTGMSPARSHIIEFGGVDNEGKEFQRLYGVPKDHARWNGTGAEHVHGISEQEVAGKPEFLYDESARKEVNDFIDNRVMVAHYSQFEDGHLRENSVPVNTVCTMRLFGALVDDPSVNGNKMEDFMKWADVPYEDAHRALPDAKMMRAGFQKLLPLLERELSS